MARPILYDEPLRELLLKTTADIVVSKGINAVTVRSVAAAAETSTTAIYSLFGNKAGLVSAVLNHAFNSFGGAQREALPEGLDALGQAYRSWALENRAFYLILFGGLQSETRSWQPDLMLAREAFTPLVTAVAMAQQAGKLRADLPPMTIATIFWSQVHGIVSLELGGFGDPSTDWGHLHSLLLESNWRAWQPMSLGPAVSN